MLPSRLLLSRPSGNLGVKAPLDFGYKAHSHVDFILRDSISHPQQSQQGFQSTVSELLA